jgi:hypothetical protein
VTYLPNAVAAIVEESKVKDYLLNSGHPRNGGKSAYFHAFGFQVAQWAVMRDAMIGHATANQLSGTSQSRRGIKHTVRCLIITHNGRNPCITTVWIIDGDRPPRLVTSYP